MFHVYAWSSSKHFDSKIRFCDLPLMDGGSFPDLLAILHLMTVEVRVKSPLLLGDDVVRFDCGCGSMVLWYGVQIDRDTPLLCSALSLERERLMVT